MFADSLFGFKVVVVEDRSRLVVDFHLPRTRARTSSVRKAYNRIRRNNPVVYKTVVTRFEDTNGAECLLVGETVYVSPRGMAKLRKGTATLSEPPERKPQLPARTTFSASELTTESLLNTMKRFRETSPFDAILKRPVTLPPLAHDWGAEMSAASLNKFYDYSAYVLAPVRPAFLYTS